MTPNNEIDRGAAEEALTDYAWDYESPGIQVHAEYSRGVDEDTVDALEEAGFEFNSVDVRGEQVDVKFEQVR